MRLNKNHALSFLPPPKHLSHKSWELNLSSLDSVLETWGVCNVWAGLGTSCATNSKHTLHLSSWCLSPPCPSERSLSPNTIHLPDTSTAEMGRVVRPDIRSKHAWCPRYICWIEVRLEGVSGFTTHHDMGILAYILYMKYDTIPICQSAHLSIYLVCLIYLASYISLSLSITYCSVWSNFFCLSLIFFTLIFLTLAILPSLSLSSIYPLENLPPSSL